MNEENTRTNTKRICYGIVAVAGAALLITGGYVAFHNPDVVKNPCTRSFFRADGIPKVAFDKAWKANLQSVIQFVRYGEICNSYQVGELFFTGHSNKAFCRCINPFK